MSLLPVAEALDKLFALVSPVGTETLPLTQSAGRILRAPVRAARDQPPFAASAMDGYAVGPGAEPGATLRIAGISRAGAGHHAPLEAGKAVRIFTGAPVPPGTARVVIQEDTTREGDIVRLDAVDEAAHIRPAGTDFAAGTTLQAPCRLTPACIALIAAMNHSVVTVARRPVVAILANGDELVAPGGEPGADQITASNSYGLAAMLGAMGAEARLLPIAPDDPAAIAGALTLGADADLILTIGGASVGDHDLIGATVADLGLEQAFYKIAMRPGKPLMAGRLGRAMMIGLPGNPVSAMVCGTVFVAPVVKALCGLPAAPAERIPMPLAEPLPAGGPREHYMRAGIEGGSVRVAERQDSSLLSVLADADALVVQPPGAPAMAAGDSVDVIRLS